jgi:hypothetical protein
VISNKNNKDTEQRGWGALNAKGGEGKSLTTWLEKAGAVAHAQQPRAGKLIKVAEGGKLHRRGGRPTSHMSCK